MSGDDKDDDWEDEDEVMFSQPSLCAAILKYLDAAGLKSINNRQMNAVIKGATDIYMELQKEHRPSVANSGIQAWLASDDTGLSSKYLLEQLAKAIGATVHWEGFGGKPSIVRGVDHPHDPGDFGRCLRMLEACPSLRSQIGFMCGGHGPEWGALARNWEQLEALYREEAPSGRCPKLYDKMQELFKSANIS